MGYQKKKKNHNQNRHQANRFNGLQVEVINGDINKALRQLKKAMANEGMFKEFSKRRHYEKPSTIRRRKKAESRKRKMKVMAVINNQNN